MFRGDGEWMDNVESNWEMTHHWHISLSFIGPEQNGRGLYQGACARTGLGTSSITTYHIALQDQDFLLAASLEQRVLGTLPSIAGNRCMFDQWVMELKDKFYSSLRIHFIWRKFYAFKSSTLSKTKKNPENHICIFPCFVKAWKWTRFSKLHFMDAKISLAKNGVGSGGRSMINWTCKFRVKKRSSMIFKAGFQGCKILLCTVYLQKGVILCSQIYLTMEIIF